MDKFTGSSTLDIFYRNWQLYNEQLVRAVEPLTAEQLALTVGSDLRSVGKLASHIIDARAGWMMRALGIADAQLPHLESLDKPESSPSGAELAAGLKTTFALLQEAISGWSEEEMTTAFNVQRRDQTRTFTRAWVVWHLIEHDLHHGGELSYSLGIHGLPAIDL